MLLSRSRGVRSSSLPPLLRAGRGSSPAAGYRHEKTVVSKPREAEPAARAPEARWHAVACCEGGGEAVSHQTSRRHGRPPRPSSFLPGLPAANLTPEPATDPYWHPSVSREDAAPPRPRSLSTNRRGRVRSDERTTAPGPTAVIPPHREGATVAKPAGGQRAVKRIESLPGLSSRSLPPRDAGDRSGGLARLRNRSRPHLESIATAVLSKAPPTRSGQTEDEKACALAAEVRHVLDTADNNLKNRLFAEIVTPAELEALKTAEDAIAFFVRHGDASPIKTLYCERPCKEAPYDLVVIPEERAQSEYFVISASGVLHVRPDQLTEHVGLDVWMRERHVFRLLTAIPLVKLYRPRKYFSLWSASVRRACYERHRRQLAHECLLARPTFVQPLLDVRRASYCIEVVQLLCFPEEGCGLDEFEAAQHVFDGVTPGRARQEVEDSHLQAMSVLEGLASRSKRDADLETAGMEDFTQQGSIDSKASATPSRRPPQAVHAAEFFVAAGGRLSVPGLSVFGQGKGPSLAEARHELKVRERRSKAACHNWAKVSATFHFADYMLQSAFVSAANAAALELCRQLEFRKQPLLLISVRATANGICLQPPMERFAEVLGKLKDRIVALGRAAPQVAANRSLWQYCKETASASPGIPVVHRAFDKLLAGSGAFERSFANAQETLTAQLQMTSNFAAAQWAPCKRIHAFGCAWDKDWYMRRSHTCESFEADLGLMQEFRYAAENMRPTYNCGALHFDGSAARDEMCLVAQQASVVIKDTVVRVAREKCASATHQLDAAAKKLDDRSTRLEIRAPETRDALMKSMLAAGDLYGLLNRHHIRIPQKDELSYNTLLVREEHLMAKLEEHDKLGALLSPERCRKIARSPSSESTASTDSPPREVAAARGRCPRIPQPQPQFQISIEVDMSSDVIPLSFESALPFEGPPELTRLLSAEDIDALKPVSWMDENPRACRSRPAAQPRS